MSLIYAELVDCIKNTGGMLVSVVSESGSAPRGVGAKMLVRPDGTIDGSIGGGAVEHTARKMALEAFTEEKSFLHQFYLSPNQLSDIGMICGGDIDVYFQYLPKDHKESLALFGHIVHCLEENLTCTLITTIGGDRCNLALVAEDSPAPPHGFAATLATNRLHVVVEDGCRYVVEPIVAGERVLIFGSGHVGRALAVMLRWLGFYTVALDDREEFLREDYIPGANERRLVDLDASVESLGVTHQDYIVIMTRGHLNDYSVLRQALKTPARYVGMIGSRSKISGANEKLLNDGFTQADIDRVYAPIGIPLGGKTPEEIALSVAAQLVRIRNDNA